MDQFLEEFVKAAVANAKANRERYEAEYPAYVERTKAEHQAALEFVADLKARGVSKIPEVPDVPVIAPASPKTPERLSITVRANPMVARAYPEIAGYKVERDENDGELAITVVDEDGDMLARYSGVRG